MADQLKILSRETPADNLQKNPISSLSMGVAIDDFMSTLAVEEKCITIDYNSPG